MAARKFSQINIFIDEDYDHKSVTDQDIGRKGYSLFKLRDMDVPVPRFFTISGKVFSQFVNTNVGPSLDNKITSEKITKLIKDGEFDEKIAHQIKIGYSRISGFSNSWVGVRSSIILPKKLDKLSFAGQLETVLNARGVDEVFDAIKSVYASAFTKEMATYLLSNGLSLSDIKVGIIIQKMVQAEVSGVTFTVDPITQKDNLMSIEAVFGLGEVIADGDITPDQYVVDKETLKFEEKKVVPQKWMMIRRIKHKSGEDGKQKIDISPLWQTRQKLENRFIEELVKICMQIEKKEKRAQDVEWVYEGGHLWVLQTSKASSIRLKEYDLDVRLDVDRSIRESVEQINQIEEAKKKFKEQLEDKGLDLSKPKIEKRIEKEESRIKKETPKSLREILKKKSEKRDTKKIKPKSGEKLLITGIGASKGSFRGKTVLVKTERDYEKSLKDGYVLVLKDLPKDIEGRITLGGAVICDIGGLTSDLATVCREKGIPCVLGTGLATKILKDGEMILVDGEVGAIYGAERPSSPTATTSQGLKSKNEVVIEKELPKKVQIPEEEKESITEPTKKEEPIAKTPTATKIYIDLSYGIKTVEKSSRKISGADGISHIRLEDVYREIGRHPGAYVEEGRSKDFIKDAAQRLSDIVKFAEGDPVIIGLGGMTVGQYKKLTKGSSLEKYEDPNINDNTCGLQRLLAKPKELDMAIKIIKRVRNVHGHRNVSIAVEFAGTPANVVEFKKKVSSNGLRRSSTFKIFLMVDTPSIALIVDQYESAGIDGMIIDIKSLKKLMMAPDYDSASILKIIDQIKASLDGGLCIVRFPGKSKKIMNKIVGEGFYGVAVTRKNLEFTRKNISKLERKVLFK